MMTKMINEILNNGTEKEKLMFTLLLLEKVAERDLMLDSKIIKNQMDDEFIHKVTVKKVETDDRNLDVIYCYKFNFNNRRLNCDIHIAKIQAIKSSNCDIFDFRYFTEPLSMSFSVLLDMLKKVYGEDVLK